MFQIFTQFNEQMTQPQHQQQQQQMFMQQQHIQQKVHNNYCIKSFETIRKIRHCGFVTHSRT